MDTGNNGENTAKKIQIADVKFTWFTENGPLSLILPIFLLLYYIFLTEKYDKKPGVIVGTISFDKGAIRAI